MTISASRAFRRLLHPRRDNPLARPPRVEAAREWDAAKKRWESVRTHWEQGWERRKDERVAVERDADALLRSNELPAAADPHLLGAAERMLNSATASIIPVVGTKLGAATALRVKIRSDNWTIASGRTTPTAGEPNAWWWMLAEANANGPRTVDKGWIAVRAVCCAADDDAYAAAREAATEERGARADVLQRIPIDFAFPSEVVWAAEDMRALFGLANFLKLTHMAAPLFASLVDEDVCTQFLKSCAPRQTMGMLPYACDLVVGMPIDAATRVVLLLAEVSLRARHYDETELHRLATALTAIESEEMARGLAKYALHPRVGSHVVSYFEKHADLARSALTSEAWQKSVTADQARHLIAGHDNASAPNAGTLDDAPALLRDPPWRTSARPLLTLERLPYEESINWDIGERERFVALPPVMQSSAQVRAIEPAELAEFDALPDVQKYVDVWPRWTNRQWLVLELPNQRRIELWNGGRARLYHRAPCFMLAVYGESALDGLFKRDPFDAYDDRMLASAMRVDSPRAALVCARIHMRRRPWRQRTRTWLTEHAEAAAIGLIPAAFGRQGRGRRIAERALRYLAAHRPEVVQSVAKRYGPVAEQAVQDFVFVDPLARIDVRGNPPAWIRIEALPPLLTKDGRHLPREVARSVVDVFRSRGDDVPYSGVQVLREELDPRSLTAFTWALFLTWVLHGRKRMHEWMAVSLAVPHDEGDDIVAKLAPYAREWTHADPRACVTLVDLLSAIGTDAAKVELAAIAEAARAPILIEAVTEALGPRSGAAPFHVGLDERGEAVLGLDERGEAVLDLGSRTVRVVLDEHLVPTVVTDDGRRLHQVPRPRKEDDPRLAALATARFNRMRREAKTVGKSGVRRMERDMVSGRGFSVAELEKRFVRHPLFGHAARRLVWELLSLPAPSTFRIVEDGSFADENDLPVSLDPDARVGIVHPLNLDDAMLVRWGTLFADYELLQPFDQLGRLAFRGNRDEAADILKSTAGATIEARALLATLDAHGWTRPAGRRVASAWREYRSHSGNVRAVISFAPGISLEQVRLAPPQKLGAMAVAGQATLQGLEKVDLSEVVRTALTLRA